MPTDNPNIGATQYLDTFLNFNKTYKKAGFFGQTAILLRKNFKVTFGKWNFCTGHVITLALVCLIILFINYLTKYSYDNEPARIYPVESVSNLQKCDFDPSCKSLGYVQIGPDQPWIDFVLTDISKKSGLSIQDDFKLLYKGDDVTQALSDIKKKNSNSFSTIVVLCTSSFTFGNMSIPCTSFGAYTYWLLYNQSLVKQNFLDNMNAPLKLSMDAIKTARMVENALSTYILQHDYGLVGNPDVVHNYSAQDFPKVQSRVLVDFDTSSSQGNFWFFIPIMVSFLNLNTEILNEKERKLRQGLMLFGVSSAAYWVSWIIYTLVLDILYAGLMTASGYISGFSFFTNCPWYLLYITFFATLFSCHVLGFLLCAMVGDNKTGSKYGYSIMLISIFYQIFFSNKMFLQLIYTKELPWAIIGLYYFMYINPSFHFANVIVSIITTAGNHYNNSTAMWEKGTWYTWDMFTKSVQGSLFGRDFDLPSPLQSLFSIAKVSGILLVCVYIFDNLIASNRGYTRNPFPLGKMCSRKGKDEDVLVVRDGPAGESPREQGPTGSNREIVVEDEKCLNGVVMKDLWKSYIASCYRKDAKKKDWALRDINLQIRQGELLALLGPNGAGKTTMIGIMSGILEPTRGTFFSNGLNSKTEQSQIRSITNVCPQFDILWDELTVEDHIRMVCRIKGVAASEVDKMAEALLAIVNLPDSLKNKIGNLSGGMKRRISIALATIGNPSILIFDEPTTGLDPENRRIVWWFINKLKESKRTILLTTHLLEEVAFKLK